jgi:hypothetical protein
MSNSKRNSGEIVMKKIIVRSTILLFAILFVACNMEENNYVTTSISVVNTSTNTSISEIGFTKPVVDWVVPEYIPGSVIEDKVDDSFIANEETLYMTFSHRYCWIMIPGPVLDLVDSDEKLTWNDYEKNLKRTSKGEPVEMTIVSFIKFFNISKKDFELAIKKAQETQYISSEANPAGEFFELPNPDIIYTFDDEIINNYYRRE